ncbi:MAG: hypothetical protein IJV37_08105 [Bacteroidales bacterium]|nr:hypothetical protein [Bacteroidales bacterium]
MLFAVKKYLMRRAIGKRSQRQPFDYQLAEQYALEGVDDPQINNSYYFSAHGEEMSVFVRLGQRIHVDETWFAIFRNGKLYSLRQELFAAGASPVKVSKTGENWTVSYEGPLNDRDEIRFHGTFFAGRRPIDFSSDMPAVRMATGVANEKWNRAFFSRLQTISGQCHYEQEGVLSGELTLDGERVDFHLPCVRDHSFGRRDWDYMNNHLWLMAVSDAVQFNYSLVSYPALSVLEVGNYRDAAGQHYLLQADLDLQQIGRGTIPEELSFCVRLDDAGTLPVKARVLTGVSYSFQDGQYLLYENIAEFVLGDQVCRGILEIGFNADPSRYFNHRDLATIKR